MFPHPAKAHAAPELEVLSAPAELFTVVVDETPPGLLGCDDSANKSVRAVLLLGGNSSGWSSTKVRWYQSSSVSGRDTADILA